MSKAVRLSNIELLRILAIVLIVMMHAAGYITKSSCDTNRMVLAAINVVGNMGVTVFVLISGFFGIRFRWSGLLRLWLVMLFYAVGILAFKVSMNEAVVDAAAVIKALTPVTSQTWWFMTCYVILYLLSPFVNLLVERLSRRQLLTLLGIMTFFYVLSPTFLLHELTDDMHGKGLPNMLTAYLLGRYVARWGWPSWFERHCGTLYLAIVVVLYLLTTLVANIFCRDNNLLIVMGALSLFCWTAKHPFRVAWVNQLAAYVFPLYLANTTILHELSGEYQPLMNSVSVWPAFVQVLLAVLLLSFAVETVRRLLFDKPIDLLCQKINHLSNSEPS